MAPNPIDLIWQKQIIREVGDPNSTMADIVSDLWDAFSSPSGGNLAVNSRLRFLYTKRGIIDARLAEEQASFDFQTGQDKFTVSQKFAHLQQMRGDCQAEIDGLEKSINASRPPAFAPLTTVTPTTPPFPDSADANAPIYRGSPYETTGEAVV